MDTEGEQRSGSLKLGISSYTFGWAIGVRGHEPAHPLDEYGLIDWARELGVSVIQIGDNLPLHIFDHSRLERFAACASEQHVELELGARGLTLDRVAEYARIARRLQAKLIRIVIDDGDYRPKATEVVGVLRKCAPLLGDITLGIENHDRFTATSLRTIIKDAAVANVGVCLDTANSLGAGEGIEHVATVLGPVAVNLHIKDFEIKRVAYLMGFEVSGRPAGSGMLNVPSLLQKLVGARCRTAILELWTPPEATIEETIAKEAAWARQSIDYLKPFFH